MTTTDEVRRSRGQPPSSTFEGRSRLTTWAYRFAILPAATVVRRRAWARREVSPDDVKTRA